MKITFFSTPYIQVRVNELRCGLDGRHLFRFISFLFSSILLPSFLAQTESPRPIRRRLDEIASEKRRSIVNIKNTRRIKNLL
jgi:hypothetical protein